MSCLQFCRWCCCCFVATINVLTAILGLCFLVSGCLAAWGYWAMKDQMEPILRNMGKQLEQSVDVSEEKLRQLHEVASTIVASTAIILIVLGVVILLFSCLGCCGACFGVPACLIIYVVFVGLMVITQLVFIIIWFANNEIFLGCFRRMMDNKVSNYKGESAMDLNTLTVDMMQVSLQCCGVMDGEEYRTMPNWNRTYGMKEKNGKMKYFNLTYPSTCCKYEQDSYTGDVRHKDKNCPMNNTESNYKIGCYPRLKELLTTYGLNNMLYSMLGDLGMGILLIVGALVIYFYKKQEQADIPHSGVQYKMQPQMS